MLAYAALAGRELGDWRGGGFDRRELRLDWRRGGGGGGGREGAVLLAGVERVLAAGLGQRGLVVGVGEAARGLGGVVGLGLWLLGGRVDAILVVLVVVAPVVAVVCVLLGLDPLAGFGTINISLVRDRLASREGRRGAVTASG